MHTVSGIHTRRGDSFLIANVGNLNSTSAELLFYMVCVCVCVTQRDACAYIVLKVEAGGRLVFKAFILKLRWMLAYIFFLARPRPSLILI